MNATAWVALVGIVSTLIVGLTAPYIAEQMRRKSARAERLMTERIALYGELVTVIQETTTALMDQAELRGATAPRPSQIEAQDRLYYRARVLGGRGVRAAMHHYNSRTADFTKLITSDYDWASDQQDLVDTIASGIDAVAAAFAAVEEAIREELGNTETAQWTGRLTAQAHRVWAWIVRDAGPAVAKAAKWLTAQARRVWAWIVRRLGLGLDDVAQRTGVERTGGPSRSASGAEPGETAEMISSQAESTAGATSDAQTSATSEA
jgi:hypothetical protein